MLKISEELIVNSVSEEIVIILDSDSLNLFEINSCGMAIFILLDGKNSFDDVLNSTKKMCCKYETNFDEKILRDYVNSLIELGLIKETEYINEGINNSEIYKEWKMSSFNPSIKMISDMSEGFFSKVHIE